MAESARLRVYRLDPGASFEGGLLSAIERMELMGDTKLLDALFVTRDAADALQAIDLAARTGEGTFASLLDFRLDPGRRQAITDRTLAAHPAGSIEAIGASLDVGASLLAVVYTGSAPAPLDDAVARANGRRVADEAVDARELSELDERLRAAAQITRFG